MKEAWRKLQCIITSIFSLAKIVLWFSKRLLYKTAGLLAGWPAGRLAGQFYQPVQPIAMKEITVAMQNKTKVDIRMSSNPLLKVLRTQFLLNCNTFIFRTIEYYRVEK